MIDAQEIIRRARNAGVDAETIIAMLMDSAAQTRTPDTPAMPATLPLLLTQDAMKCADGKKEDEDRSPDGIHLPPRNTPEMIRDHGTERFCSLSKALDRLGFTENYEMIRLVRNQLDMKMERENRDIMEIAPLLVEVGFRYPDVECIEFGCMCSLRAITSRSLDIKPAFIYEMANMGKVHRTIERIAENGMMIKRAYFDVFDLVHFAPLAMGERWCKYVSRLRRALFRHGETMKQEAAQ